MARRVALVALGAHRHHLVNTSADHSAVEARHAENKLEQLSELFFLVSQNVLKSEEVNRLVCVFGDVDPVLEPLSVRVRGLLIEIFPIRQNVFAEERVLEVGTVALRVRQVEERGISVQLVPCAHDCDVRLPILLER